MGLDVRPVKGDLGKLPRTAFGETDVAWHTDGDDDVGVNDRGLGDVFGWNSENKLFFSITYFVKEDFIFQWDRPLH